MEWLKLDSMRGLGLRLSLLLPTEKNFMKSGSNIFVECLPNVDSIGETLAEAVDLEFVVVEVVLGGGRLSV